MGEKLLLKRMLWQWQALELSQPLSLGGVSLAVCGCGHPHRQLQLQEPGTNPAQDWGWAQLGVLVLVLLLHPPLLHSEHSAHPFKTASSSSLPAGLIVWCWDYFYFSFLTVSVRFQSSLYK